jgi:hypothetical protein
MTKAQLTTAISSALSIVITKVKVLASLGNIVDNLYPTTITEQYTNLSTIATNTTAIGTTHYYATYWKKQGNVVMIKGTITNKTGSTASNTDWITISGSEFLPVTGLSVDSYIVTGFSLNDNRPILFRINGTKITLISSIGINESVSLDVKYYTE